METEIVIFFQKMIFSIIFWHKNSDFSFQIKKIFFENLLLNIFFWAEFFQKMIIFGQHQKCRYYLTISKLFLVRSHY